MRKKQNTNANQTTWSSNGYVADSKYQTTPHNVLNAAQHARRAQHSEAPTRAFQCSYQSRIGTNEGRLLIKVKVYANSAEQAARIAAAMLYRPIIRVKECT